MSDRSATAVSSGQQQQRTSGPHSHAACLQPAQRRRPSACFPQPEQTQRCGLLACPSRMEPQVASCWAVVWPGPCRRARANGSMAMPASVAACSWTIQLWGSTLHSCLIAAGAPSAAATKLSRSARLTDAGGESAGRRARQPASTVQYWLRMACAALKARMCRSSTR